MNIFLTSLGYPRLLPEPYILIIRKEMDETTGNIDFQWFLKGFVQPWGLPSRLFSSSVKR